MEHVEGIEYYQAAAAVVHEALKVVLERCTVGTPVASLCLLGDQTMDQYASQICPGSQFAKGVAYPTSIALNGQVQNVAVQADDKVTLQLADVVKVEMAAHIDGHVASQAHTLVLNPNPQQALSDRRADTICAAKIAHEALLRRLRPGVESSELTTLGHEIVTTFQCAPVEATYSFVIDRYVYPGSRMVPNRFRAEDNQPEFTFAVGDVFVLNTLVSSGPGQVRDAGDIRPTIYQRDVTQSYYLKMKSAARFYDTVVQRHPVFPFTLRELSSGEDGLRMKLGLTECVQRGLVNPLIPLVEKRRNAFVAQFQSTVVITHKGPACITPPQAMSFVHSQYNLPAGSNAVQVLNEPLEVVDLPALATIRITKGMDNKDEVAPMDMN
ncbi:hypothetical protein IWQ60_000048 [Tieghemiomyces parasiticus]|uniref:Peptidase M24 domain-containing protein n=1 Tax=Tieghemiomyces parasiticus TaxID=78921 RepID=A0A9W8AHE6_9FUNG|nr:hypothetical protein IWQ60_000048 [Tieghemiomyces parasiticus]